MLSQGQGQGFPAEKSQILSAFIDFQKSRVR